VDEEDPVTSFRSQYRNEWPAPGQTDPLTRDEPLFPPGAWDAIRTDPDSVQTEAPVALAVDDWAGTETAVAAASWLRDGRLAVEAYACPNRAEAATWLASAAGQYPGAVVMLDADLRDSPGTDGLNVDYVAHEWHRAALSLIRSVVSRNGLADISAGSDLAAQMASARVIVSTDGGLRLNTAGKSHLLRAASWAVASLERDRRNAPNVY